MKLAGCNLQDILGAKDLESGYTPLHDAIYYGNIGCAIKLIQYGAPISTVDADGFVPLDLAVWNKLMYDFEIKVVDGKKIFPRIRKNPNCNVLTWGSNLRFNLGHKNGGDILEPKRVTALNRDVIKSYICSVEFGTYHTLFLDKAGKVYTCGYGNGGRLGLGTEQTKNIPTLIPSLKDIVKVSCSRDHSLALTSEGEVYSWGINTHRVLGHEEAFDQASPKLIEFTSTRLNGIKNVLAATYHSVLVTRNSVYTFGYNGGQIGHDRSETLYQIKPKIVLIPKETTMEQIDHVHACTAATVIGSENGLIYVCYGFAIKKVAESNRRCTLKLGLKQKMRLKLQVDGTFKRVVKSAKLRKIQVTGGYLSRDVPNETKERPKNLCIFILELNGSVTSLNFSEETGQFEISPTLLNNTAMPRESQLFFDIAIGSDSLYLLAQSGEVFSKTLGIDTSNYDVAERCSVKKTSGRLIKVDGIHHCTRIYCDEKASTVACLVRDPISAVDMLTSIEPSSFSTDILSLYDNEEVYETDCTVLLQSGNTISVHRALLANASEDLAKRIEVYEISGRSYIEFRDSDEEGKAKLTERIYRCEYGPSYINRANIMYLSDVVLISKEGTRFKCHRVILAARVPYFKAYFAFNSKWGALSLNEETLIDASEKTLTSLINYVYTDEFPKDQSIKDLLNLLILSDQYLVSRLKSFCEANIAKRIFDDNLFYLLKAANDYNADALCAMCLNIVATNLPLYLDHRLLDNVEQDIIKQIERVYKEVVLFQLDTSSNQDYDSLLHLTSMVEIWEICDQVEEVRGITLAPSNNLGRGHNKVVEEKPGAWLTLDDGPTAKLICNFREMIKMEEDELRIRKGTALGLHLSKQSPNPTPGKRDIPTTKAWQLQSLGNNPGETSGSTPMNVFNEEEQIQPTKESLPNKTHPHFTPELEVQYNPTSRSWRAFNDCSKTMSMPLRRMIEEDERMRLSQIKKNESHVAANSNSVKRSRGWSSLDNDPITSTRSFKEIMEEEAEARKVSVKSAKQLDMGRDDHNGRPSLYLPPR